MKHYFINYLHLRFFGPRFYHKKRYILRSPFISPLHAGQQTKRFETRYSSHPQRIWLSYLKTMSGVLDLIISMTYLSYFQLSGFISVYTKHRNNNSCLRCLVADGVTLVVTQDPWGADVAADDRFSSLWSSSVSKTEWQKLIRICMMKL